MFRSNSHSTIFLLKERFKKSCQDYVENMYLYTFFLYKSHILEGLLAAVHIADKVAGTPGPAQCGDEGAP